MKKILMANTNDCSKSYTPDLSTKKRMRFTSYSVGKWGVFYALLFWSSTLFSQIDFYDFKKEIDKLKKDRKVQKYWRELYRDDRDNARLKIPMDYTFLLNRLKAAYVVQKYGFPDPARFGKLSNLVFLSIVSNNCFSDLNTQTFAQVKPGDSLRLWGNKYPNAVMVNELFWYNGIEIALDQEYALALRKLNARTTDSIDMAKLCKNASDLLMAISSPDSRVVGEWTMHYRELQIPLKIIQLKDRYYLKKGKYYFELLRESPVVFSFKEVLDETTLYIFENGELVLRDKYEREMGIFPKAIKVAQ